LNQSWLPGAQPTVTLPATVSDQQRIIIPKIGVDIAFLTGNDSATLDQGAWWRYPERGDPVKGGNFILSAHRFKLGWTPAKTRAKSPFYNINKLVAGDKIYIDFKGQRYTYTVTRTYAVTPQTVSIEAPSDEPKLTLYSCTLKGALDGRDVIEAKL
jgi:sortase A